MTIQPCLVKARSKKPFPRKQSGERIGWMSSDVPLSCSSDTFAAGQFSQTVSAGHCGRYASPTEADLITLVCAGSTGDSSAQSELVRRYSRRLSGFLRPFVFRRSDVDELRQIAFIKMSRQLQLLREPAQFETWLFTLARNTAIDFIRRQRRERAILIEDMFYEEPTSESTRRVAEIMEEFKLALTHLSPVDQNLLKMRVYGDSYQLMSARTGLTVVTIKGRLCRVRPRLKALMQPDVPRSQAELTTAKTTPLRANRGHNIAIARPRFATGTAELDYPAAR